jgi:DNA-binding winged helix-turn-helix (wHTH) protein
VASQASHGVITDLLNYLRSHPGRTLSREELAADVWRARFFCGSRSIDMAVCLARKRLNGAERIVGIRGVGYRYEKHSNRADTFSRSRPERSSMGAEKKKPALP